MSSQNDIVCKSCGKIYVNIFYKWCRQCEINNLKENFTNWTSVNEKIDNFIQKMQLKIECYDDIIVEWIPYNQFNNVKKTNKDGLKNERPKIIISNADSEEMREVNRTGSKTGSKYGHHQNYDNHESTINC
ncbi:hypothetical protein RhiirA5_417804 [Rhizophagus irregularis]|uniref:Uncharacterized protein n=1 Tax=Rhizophagus irregularis TaxID=588596 RepID=A0A2N0PLT9_9GLOM|nr:hypothetical protein RhiirA5_417804 [Rhizophagus irregularis]